MKSNSKLKETLFWLNLKQQKEKQRKKEKMENKQLKKRIEERKTIKLMNELCKT